MNREMRRHLKETNNNEVKLNLTEADLERIRAVPERDLLVNKENEIQKAIKQASSTTLKKLFGLPLMVMQQEYGWKKKRLNRFLGQLIEIQKSFEAEEITMEDLDDLFKYLNVKC